MQLFMPERVFFEPSSLKYSLGRDIYNYFKERAISLPKACGRVNNAYFPGFAGYGYQANTDN
jgi:spore photoproduct lyase